MFVFFIKKVAAESRYFCRSGYNGATLDEGEKRLVEKIKSEA